MQRDGQYGAICGCHVGDVVNLDTGIEEGDAKGGDGGFEVGPSRDLGDDSPELGVLRGARGQSLPQQAAVADQPETGLVAGGLDAEDEDRKSTRLNSSHVAISYAVFCLTRMIRSD